MSHKAHYSRCPIIGVMGSGQPSVHDVVAYEFGCLLAEAGYVLLTGGGDGIMKAVSHGMARSGGLVIGILPSDSPRDPRYAEVYPNQYVHIPIYTGMANGRNIINVKSSDVVVAFPGGSGTLSEIGLALNSEKHVIIVGWDDFSLPSRCPTNRVHIVHDAPSALQLVKRLMQK